MPPLAGFWHSLLARHGRVWKAAYKEATRALEAKLSGRVPANAEYAYAQVPSRQTVHSVARIRQSQSRWLTSQRHFDAAVRYFSTQPRVTKDSVARSRTSFQSATWNAVRQSPGRAPFASTLRPNLTGGTLGRTAGGYSLGGGRVGAPRHFSHGPACQAHVVQNVSQAVRAFLVGGQKAQFNGVSSVTGGKKYKTVTKLQEETGRKMKELPRTTPGSHVAFSINPTVTALASLGGVTGFRAEEQQHLNTEGLLDVLSTDFSRQLQELCIVLGDLRKLSVLGDLPLTYQTSSLRVHFPGCDAETVERLCQELGVRRGLVVQDEDFDAFVGTEMALLFPFAPSQAPSEVEEWFEHKPMKDHKPTPQVDWRASMTPSNLSSVSSTRSEYEFDEIVDDNPWTASPIEEDSDISDEVYSTSHSPLEYQGIEGIYRFIEQCDSARRR
ncbi:hypothetical protein ANO11243_015700 [Dothideomycetidae sp. 11243]|nr:hypothetical protein ANO11243_015700 [fungal sp. No.11243]